jgi:small subunit ribosomal protein S6
MAVNKYEAMMIFPEAFKDEALEEVMNRVKAEIEKIGGVVQNMTRLGRKPFARQLHKQQGGQYSVVGFAIDGDKIPSLHARFKLDEDIFRVQIVRAPELKAVPAAPAAPAAKA